MFKKMVLLLLLETLPMFACGPTFSVSRFIQLIIVVIIGGSLISYGILFLFRGKSKKEEV